MPLMCTHTFPRRGFLAAAATGGLAAAVPAAAQRPIERGGKARLTPALNAYSFLEPLTANRDEVEARMTDDLRACAEHGARFGVLVAVQNHGDFLASGPEHLRLLARVDHPWCGALVDTGKYLTADPYADIAMMVPHAVNWQVKETLGSSLKSPRTDYDRLVKIIRDGGYRGFVPIETLAMGRADYDPAAEVLGALAALRGAITAVS